MMLATHAFVDTPWHEVTKLYEVRASFLILRASTWKMTDCWVRVDPPSSFNCSSELDLDWSSADLKYSAGFLESWLTNLYEVTCASP